MTALQTGIDLGMTLIDTAEAYADGGAEEVVGEAVLGQRDNVFIVSKVHPHHSSRLGVLTSCDRSLKRLRTDRIDLFLLHWRGNVALSETIEAFETLKATGKIRYWGVSNFSIDDVKDLAAVPMGKSVQINQVAYNLMRRGIERDLLPWCRERGLPIMAHSPIERGQLARDGRLARTADRYGVSRARLALAWILRHEGVVAIPKAATAEHVKDNRKAVELRLAPSDLAELDRLFAPRIGY
jgi:diketogulonate reductase-like aldo/keto reductase